MADLTKPGQQPQASTPGSAPVPYAGPDLSPEPPVYDLGDASIGYPGPEVMNGAAGGILQESPAAHDISAGLADAPYYPGDISPVFAGGDADAGGTDDVSGTVAGSVANAQARYIEHESDTFGMGSTIGDIVTLPPSPLDPGVGSLGQTDPSGAYYDPPRGGSPQTHAYPNSGNEPS